jgi:hypothetical protein
MLLTRAAAMAGRTQDAQVRELVRASTRDRHDVIDLKRRAGPAEDATTIALQHHAAGLLRHAAIAFLRAGERYASVGAVIAT